jgi:hypothetical protein
VAGCTLAFKLSSWGAISYPYHSLERVPGLGCRPGVRSAVQKTRAVHLQKVSACLKGTDVLLGCGLVKFLINRFPIKLALCLLIGRFDPTPMLLRVPGSKKKILHLLLTCDLEQDSCTKQGSEAFMGQRRCHLQP